MQRSLASCQAQRRQPRTLLAARPVAGGAALRIKRSALADAAVAGGQAGAVRRDVDDPRRRCPPAWPGVPSPRRCSASAGPTGQRPGQGQHFIPQAAPSRSPPRARSGSRCSDSEPFARLRQQRLPRWLHAPVSSVARLASTAACPSHRQGRRKRVRHFGSTGACRVASRQLAPPSVETSTRAIRRGPTTRRR